jgi:hypothetical protein
LTETTANSPHRETSFWSSKNPAIGFEPTTY